MSFTILPREIRDKIYKLSLCTTKVIYPYPMQYEEAFGAVRYSKWDPKEKLAVGLLGANNAIRSEAADILFSKNVWHLSGEKESAVVDQYPELVWTTHYDKFRHIEIAFHVGDVNLADRMSVACNLPEELADPRDQQGFRLRHDWENHDRLLDPQLHTWLQRMQFLSTLRLESMTVDLRHCYCGFSCCRLDEFVIAYSGMLGQWHRCSTPIKSDWTSFMDNNYGAGNIDSELQKPANLQRMKFGFQGVSTYNIMKLIHSSGLGCQRCPIKDGLQDPYNCEWATAKACRELGIYKVES